MMIQEVRFHDLRAFREASFSLRPLTVIVGPNGSGKTTILHGLLSAARLVTEEVQESSPGLLSPSLLRRLTLGSHLELMLEGLWNGTTGEVRFEPDRPDSLESETPKVFGRWGNSDWSVQAPQKMAISLGRTLLLSFAPDRLAASSAVSEEEQTVKPDGSDLAATLASLKIHESERFDEIVMGLRVVIPEVVDLQIKPTKVESESAIGYRVLFDTRSAKAVPADSISQGTLLTLGLLTVLHQEPHPKLILWDDMERGLHPKAMAQLISQIRRIQKQDPELQIVATTHSPYLLDCLDREEVLVTALRPDGSAVVKPLTEHPDIDQWRDLMAPGEFWSTVGESWVAEDPVPYEYEA